MSTEDKAARVDVIVMEGRCLRNMGAPLYASSVPRLITTYLLSKGLKAELVRSFEEGDELWQSIFCRADVVIFANMMNGAQEGLLSSGGRLSDSEPSLAVWVAVDLKKFMSDPKNDCVGLLEPDEFAQQLRDVEAWVHEGKRRFWNGSCSRCFRTLERRSVLVPGPIRGQSIGGKYVSVSTHSYRDETYCPRCG